MWSGTRRCIAVFLLLVVVGGTSALAARDRGANDAEILRNVEHAFEVQYPASYEASTRHVLDPSYEETFFFRPRSSDRGGITLRVVELKKYLPKTNTRTEHSYLNAMRQLRGFRAVKIGDKSGYQFLVCGRASCDLNLMFINEHREYTFQAHVESEDPDRAGFSNFSPEQQLIVLSLKFLH